MAIDYTAKVVKYFREKSANGFDLPISWLGAEQRFVGALRNSNVNNLEEQYTLGTDTYTIYSKDSQGNDITEINYCKTNSKGLVGVTDYYKLVVTEYKDAIPSTDFVFNGETLEIDSGMPVVFGDGSTDYPNLNMVYLLDPNFFEWDDNKLKLYPDSFAIVKKEELYFVSSINNEVLVATKMVGLKTTSDGKRIIQERIFNQLNN